MRRRDFTALSLATLGLPALAADSFVGMQSERFLEALWKLDPDAAVAAGRFEFAGRVTLPSDAQRQRMRAFLKDRLNVFECLPTDRLSTGDRIDCALLAGKIKSDLWRLDVLCEWAWNPAEHNPPGRWTCCSTPTTHRCPRG